MPVPTPRQSRKPSSESEVLVAVECEPADDLPQPPVLLSAVDEFDLLAVFTDRKQSASNNLVTIDVDYLPDASTTERLRFDAFDGRDEVFTHGSDAALIDPILDDCSHAERSERYDTSDCGEKDLNSQLSCEPVDCSTDAADAVKRANCTGSRESRDSYLNMWDCTSYQQKLNGGEPGLSFNSPSFVPPQREFIKSDESSVETPLFSPVFTSNNCEDTVFCSPPVPMKRNLSQSSTTDQSAKTSETTSRIVPQRAAPLPPHHGSEVQAQTSITRRQADKDVSNTSDGMDVSSSSAMLGLPVVPEDESRLKSSVPQDMGLSRPLSAQEDQTVIVSCQSSSDNVSSQPASSVSSHPCPRLRDIPRQPVVTSDHVYSPPPVQERRLPPLIMPKTSTSVEPITASTSVVDAAGSVTSPSSRAPPLPPPKHHKPLYVDNSFESAASMDGDTTDDDLDSGTDVRDGMS